MRQTAHSLGLFGAQYVGHQGDYSDAQRAHYRQLVLGLSRWASQAPLSDPALAQQSISALTEAVRASGLDGAQALQAAGMEPALQRLGPVQQAFVLMLDGYGLGLAQSLQALQVGLVRQDGDSAVVQVQWPLAGQTVEFQAALERHEGTWYMSQNLADAQQVLAAASQARALREQAAAAQQAADGTTIAGDEPNTDDKTAAGP